MEKLLEALCFCMTLIMLLQKWFQPIMNPSHVFWSISRHVRSLDTLSLTYIDLVRLLFFLFLFQDLSTILILIRTRILQGVSIYTVFHIINYNTSYGKTVRKWPEDYGIWCFYFAFTTIINSFNSFNMETLSEKLLVGVAISPVTTLLPVLKNITFI